MRKRKGFGGIIVFSCCTALAAVLGSGVALGATSYFGVNKAMAFETDATVIEEILGTPVGDVDKGKVDKVYNTLVSAVGMVANGKRDSKLPSGIMYEFDKRFGENIKAQSACAATVESYVTYLRGNGVFTTEFKVRTCGETLVITGSVSGDDVVLRGIGDLFEVQRIEYDARVGDSGTADMVPDNVYIKDEEPDYVEDGLTESGRDYYEDTGYTSQRSDETNE